MENMKTLFWITLGAIVSSLMLSGCQWFNSVGDHFPVIGDRCENWQCFTSSGQRQSELNKQAKQQGQASPTDTGKPVNTAGTTPTEPSASEPSPPAPTPYNMTPEQLQALPPPASP